MGISTDLMQQMVHYGVNNKGALQNISNIAFSNAGLGSKLDLPMRDAVMEAAIGQIGVSGITSTGEAAMSGAAASMGTAYGAGASGININPQNAAYFGEQGLKGGQLLQQSLRTQFNPMRMGLMGLLISKGVTDPMMLNAVAQNWESLNVNQKTNMAKVLGYNKVEDFTREAGTSMMRYTDNQAEFQEQLFGQDPTSKGLRQAMNLTGLDVRRGSLLTGNVNQESAAMARAARATGMSTGAGQAGVTVEAGDVTTSQQENKTRNENVANILAAWKKTFGDEAMGDIIKKALNASMTEVLKEIERSTHMQQAQAMSDKVNRTWFGVAGEGALSKIFDKQQ